MFKVTVFLKLTHPHVHISVPNLVFSSMLSFQFKLDTFTIACSWVSLVMNSRIRYVWSAHQYFQSCIHVSCQSYNHASDMHGFNLSVKHQMCILSLRNLVYWNTHSYIHKSATHASDMYVQYDMLSFHSCQPWNHDQSFMLYMHRFIFSPLSSSHHSRTNVSKGEYCNTLKNPNQY